MYLKLRKNEQSFRIFENVTSLEVPEKGVRYRYPEKDQKISDYINELELNFVNNEEKSKSIDFFYNITKKDLVRPDHIIYGAILNPPELQLELEGHLSVKRLSFKCKDDNYVLYTDSVVYVCNDNGETIEKV
jgi:hypothetical protein